MNEYEFEIFALQNTKQRVHEEIKWLITVDLEYGPHGSWLERLREGFLKRTMEKLLQGQRMLMTEPGKAAEILVLAKKDAREIKRQLDARRVSPLGGVLLQPKEVTAHLYVEVQPQDFASMEDYYAHMIAKIPDKNYD